jgi:hypothetical protein
LFGRPEARSRQRPDRLCRLQHDAPPPAGLCAVRGKQDRALLYLVEVLAKELGHRRVIVNSILPTAIEAAGVYATGAMSLAAAPGFAEAHCHAGRIALYQAEGSRHLAFGRHARSEMGHLHQS